MLIIYATALFWAGKGIDKLKAMSPEEFWGERHIVIENTVVVEAPKMPQEAPQAPVTVKEVVEPVKYTHTAKLTAYNSVPEQTDGNPCIAADGTNVCTFKGCVIAQNGVKFGTKVEIEGIGLCHVHDRKNSRYDSNWIDIYFGGRDKVADAFQFGKREAKYRIIE